VKGAVNRQTGEKFAVKIIERDTLEEDDEMALE
jgi:hypothetical protein